VAKKISEYLWLKRKQGDKYFYAAKSNGYRARSVYKLFEINKKFNVIKGNLRVADLGAAPGSWSQMLSDKLFSKGNNNKSKVYAIDLQTIDPIEKVIIIKKDIKDFLKESYIIDKNSLDLVLSDMAPKATGHRFTDQARAEDLVQAAVDFAKHYLAKNGNFICKLLGINNKNNLIKQMKKYYKSVKLFKPESSMKNSKEIYLICLSFNNLH
jgi:23S rRNA (uridine2552-2'-O)-methyltransferase